MVETSFYAAFVTEFFARNVISSVRVRSEYETMQRTSEKKKKKKKKKKKIYIYILFIIFAQNIYCGHVIPWKTSFARQLAILNTK